MRSWTSLCFLSVISVICMNCASTTMIQSDPIGAKVYADGVYLGRTPVEYSDRKVLGSTTQIKLVKDGCDPRFYRISRSEKFQIWPCLAGLVTLVPFLWVMGYDPEHVVPLRCGEEPEA